MGIFELSEISLVLRGDLLCVVISDLCTYVVGEPMVPWW